MYLSKNKANDSERLTLCQDYVKILYVGDFCTSAHLKALNLNLNALKKANGLAFGSAEVQKSTREFSNGLNFSLIPIYE